MGKKKRKNNTPRRKRTNRATRMPFAKRWLRVYNGKNLIKGYSKWFGVDKLCAIVELRLLGVEISEDREVDIRESIAENFTQNAAGKKRRPAKGLPSIDANYFYAYVAGYTSGGAPFGITHEQMEKIIHMEEMDKIAAVEQMEEIADVVEVAQMIEVERMKKIVLIEEMERMEAIEEAYDIE